MKKTFLFLILLVVLTASTLQADSFYVPPYYAQSDFLTTTPGVAGDASGSFFNPAVWALQNGFEMQYYWNDLDKSGPTPKNWTLVTGVSGMGFGMQHWSFPVVVGGKTVRKSINDYHLAIGLGDKANCFGIGYGWSKGDFAKSQLRDNTLSFGYLSRPCRHVSIGLAGHWAMREDDVRGIADIGVRPFGTSLLTLFGDATMMSSQKLEDVLWSAGASVEPIPGIKFFGKYFEETEAFTAGVSFSSVSAMSHFDKDNEISYTTYGIRVGNPKPDPITPIVMKDKIYVRMNFDGRIKYQRYKLFDKGGHTLMELLETLEDVKNDKRVAGIVLKITEDMYGSPELIWEVREKIKDVQASGKKVVVFLERGDTFQYYLASVADKIMVDPETIVGMLGFNMGRTYYRKMLDKLGIGVDKWQFFTYKSAAEGIADTSMSDADREQRKALIDGWYETLREDICESRGISHDDFDYVVNEIGIISADSLLAYGFVDTTGRWDEMSDLIKEVEDGKGKNMLGMSAFAALQPEYDEWGIPPKIAIIYGLGPCAMNYGLNARKLGPIIKRARENKHIKAIVFRADSPGGDILPSDIVAMELKKAAEEKPVIVTQGFVAGSGGYWISMYGDKIVASPWTITGSIGVIGLWLYNDGFGDKIGLNYDYTKVGKHADLGGGIVLPFINARIPERNLTETERQFMEKLIRGWYQDFLSKVAEGRDMTKDEVHEVAQGRVWTGTTGKEIGLVDEIGGMELAIKMARDTAGIKPNRRIQTVEMPGKGLMNPSMFQPKLLGIQWSPRWLQQENEELQYLRMMIEAEGKPMIMMSPDLIVD